jgi:hypothetical protein
MEQFLLNTCR